MTDTLLGIDSRVAYTLLVGIIALQRLWELSLSNRHMVMLRAQGGFEVGSGHYPVMVVLHSGFLLSCVAEVWLLQRPWALAPAAVSMAVLAGALALRWWALSALGVRWTTRVVVIPNEPLIDTGPYRLMKHPNYFAVILEIAAIPMVHCAWLTAIIFSIANLALLKLRISVEDRALAETGAERVPREAA